MLFYRHFVLVHSATAVITRPGAFRTRPSIILSSTAAARSAGRHRARRLRCLVPPPLLLIVFLRLSTIFLGSCVPRSWVSRTAPIIRTPASRGTSLLAAGRSHDLAMRWVMSILIHYSVYIQIYIYIWRQYLIHIIYLSKQKARYRHIKIQIYDYIYIYELSIINIYIYAYIDE